MKKEEKDGIETSPILEPAIFFYLSLRLQTLFPLSINVRFSSGTPTTTNPYDARLPPPFSLPILTEAADTAATVPTTSAPSCFAHSKYVKFPSGTPTFTNIYGGSLNCHHRSPTSAPSCCALSRHVRHCHFYQSLRQ